MNFKFKVHIHNQLITYSVNAKSPNTIAHLNKIGSSNISFWVFLYI